MKENILFCLHSAGFGSYCAFCGSLNISRETSIRPDVNTFQNVDIHGKLCVTFKGRRLNLEFGGESITGSGELPQRCPWAESLVRDGALSVENFSILRRSTLPPSRNFVSCSVIQKRYVNCHYYSQMSDAQLNIILLETVTQPKSLWLHRNSHRVVV